MTADTDTEVLNDSACTEVLELGESPRLQLESLDAVSARVDLLEQALEKQDSKAQTIIVTVVIAAFFVFLTIALEVIVSDVRDERRVDSVHAQIDTLAERLYATEMQHVQSHDEIDTLNKDLEQLRSRNAYLR